MTALYEFEYRKWHHPAKLMSDLGAVQVQINHSNDEGVPTGITTVVLDNILTQQELDNLKSNLEDTTDPYATPPPKSLAVQVAELTAEVDTLKTEVALLKAAK